MKVRSERRAGRHAAAWLASMVLPAAALAQAPGEVTNLSLTDPTTLTWDAVAGADFYNIYTVPAAELQTGSVPQCHSHALASTGAQVPDAVAPGEIRAYLVTAEAAPGGEGTPGTDSSGVLRRLRGACGPVVRLHVQNRAGFGASEWSRARINLIGIDSYLDEQLDPTTIDESTNTPLNNGLAPLTPPADIFDLIGRQVISALHARRQLEQDMAVFWTNHFNTFWNKVAQVYQGVFPRCTAPGTPVQCDPSFPAVAYREASLAQMREMEEFRDLGFHGNFRTMLEASALSPAMILYLDSYANINGRPNENYSRELLELSSMGVDGGFTQTDVEELARILTGWTICRKTLADRDDPTAPCISSYWQPTPAGEWVAHHDFSIIQGLPRHDCGAKTLFAGTPQQVNFPATPCLDPAEGVAEFHLALDAIAAHPSTPRFISKKILQHLVTDEPTEAMIDALVAVWNDAGNPQGIGDLREVTRAALELPEFRSPQQAGSKIRTPFEQFIAAMRAIRGTSDGTSQILNYLVSAQYIPHFNETPTGYPEVGAEWIDTNNTLIRQNFGIHLAAVSGAAFGSDPIGLLAANGISTAPGNQNAIVDFFAGILLGGAITPAGRQEAITYLTTNTSGAPSPYDATRIRDTVALLLGFPQFQEQ